MNLHRKIKKYWKQSVFVVLIAVCGIGFGFFMQRHQNVFAKTATVHLKTVSESDITDLRAYADQVVKKCADAPYKPTCYEEEIPKLMDTITMRQAFQVTSMVQQEDTSYAYCHVLGHKLAARETAKDPEKWKDVIDMCPVGQCSNGCIHGAFQQRFRNESLTDAQLVQYKPELADICEPRSSWEPTDLEQATCYHALGHLFMYVTNADVAKSVSLCRELTIKDNGARDYSQLCFDGVFMQIFQPLETEDFALVAGKQPTEDQMNSYCKPFTGTSREPCWAESWPLVRNQILTSKGAVQFCTNPLLATKDDQLRCFRGLFYVVTAQVQLDSEKVSSFCNGIIPSRMGLCFANGASRMIETDFKYINQAVALCSSAQLVQAKSQCYDELVNASRYDFHPGQPELTTLCQALPDPWKSRCGQ